MGRRGEDDAGGGREEEEEEAVAEHGLAPGDAWTLEETISTKGFFLGEEGALGTVAVAVAVAVVLLFFLGDASLELLGCFLGHRFGDLGGGALLSRSHS